MCSAIINGGWISWAWLPFSYNGSIINLPASLRQLYELCRM